MSNNKQARINLQMVGSLFDKIFSDIKINVFGTQT